MEHPCFIDISIDCVQTISLLATPIWNGAQTTINLSYSICKNLHPFYNPSWPSWTKFPLHCILHLRFVMNSSFYLSWFLIRWKEIRFLQIFYHLLMFKTIYCLLIFCKTYNNNCFISFRLLVPFLYCRPHQITVIWNTSCLSPLCSLFNRILESIYFFIKILLFL